MFYKAYGELKNKEPVSRRKSRILKEDWQEVAGYLKDDVILFDIDDKDVNYSLFKILNDTFSFNCHITESRNGYHIMFKRPKVDSIGFGGNGKETLCGIMCDYKAGYLNQYERIKVDGKYHNVVQYCSYDELDELPFMLFPLSRKLDLQGKEEGDNRHGTLTFLGSLMSTYCDDPDTIIAVLEFINFNVFKEPRKSVNYSRRDASNAIAYRRSLDGYKNATEGEILSEIANLGLSIRQAYDLMVKGGLYNVQNEQR